MSQPLAYDRHERKYYNDAKVSLYDGGGVATPKYVRTLYMFMKT